jgi:hypothetical protein
LGFQFAADFDPDKIVFDENLTRMKTLLFDISSG